MPKPSTYSQVDTYSLMPDTGNVDSWVPETVLSNFPPPEPWTPAPVDTYSLVPDTGGADDWETMLESGQLDQSLNNLSLFTQPKPQVKILTDDCRTQYKPPEPKLTILKRPSSQPVNSGQVRQKAPTKTLEQREADYAQARQRILGKDGNSQQGKVKVQVKGKEKGGKEVKEAKNTPVGASRNPRGTDGTKGFNGRQQNQNSAQGGNQNSGRSQNNVQGGNQTNGRQHNQSNQNQNSGRQQNYSVQSQNQFSVQSQNQFSVQGQNQFSVHQQNQTSGRQQNQPASSR